MSNFSIVDQIYRAACQYIETVVDCNEPESRTTNEKQFDISCCDIPGIFDALIVENLEIEE